MDQEKVVGMSNRNRCKKCSGYEVSIKNCIAGIFLNIDACIKFLREKTVLNEIKERINNGEKPKDIYDEFDSSNQDQPRKTVIS